MTRSLVGTVAWVVASLVVGGGVAHAQPADNHYQAPHPRIVVTPPHPAAVTPRTTAQYRAPAGGATAQQWRANPAAVAEPRVQSAPRPAYGNANGDWQQRGTQTGAAPQYQAGAQRGWQRGQAGNPQVAGDRSQWRGGPGQPGAYRGPQGNYQAWNRGWQHDQRYNWQTWRYQNRAVFHLGAYYAPYNDFYYSPLSIGFYLDPAFYGDDYFIDDPWTYRLPEAQEPYRWVRYYNDVVLVDTYTGQVVDVIHNFFW